MKTKGLVAIGFFVLCSFLTPNPGGTQPADLVTFDGEPLGQGWSPQLRKQFYHWAQGTKLIRLELLLALKQQGSSTAKFLDDANIRKWGFIPDPKHSEHNEYGLPVGFAFSELMEPIMTPEGPKKILVKVVGWTCAACHTGQIIAKGKKIQIDGAPSMQNNLRFVWALEEALKETSDQPTKFDDFAKEVYGVADPIPAQKDRLRMEVKGLLDKLALVRPDGGKELAKANCNDPVMKAKYSDPNWHVYPKESWGFGRGDAVGRPSNNFFFATFFKVPREGGHPCNLDTADTPVSIPKVWYAGKHNWVQWNAFVENPLARNLAQALALNAEPHKNTEFELVKNLDWLEEQIEKLQPPRWDLVFGAVDMKKAADGKDLYFNGRPNRRVAGGLCAHCHVPQKVSNDKREDWQIVRIPMTEIGTDYGTKESYWRTKQGSPGSGEAAFKPAEWLARKTSEVMADQFARWKVSPNDQQQMQRFRLTNQWPVTDQYKAQTHSGVWATAPYLHNGSVPNLYLLLGTKEERDEQARTFCVGHDLTYDPVNVGFVLTQKCDDMYKFDTSRPNNSNKGHEFKDAPDCDKREGDFAKNGVLGCALSHDERMALIEYLKTIPETEPVGR